MKLKLFFFCSENLLETDMECEHEDGGASYVTSYLSVVSGVHPGIWVWPDVRPRNP